MKKTYWKGDWRPYAAPTLRKKIYLACVKAVQRKLYGNIPNNNDWYMKDE